MSRAGRKNFERCSVNKISYRTLARTVALREDGKPKRQRIGNTRLYTYEYDYTEIDPTTADYDDVVFGAVVRCPRIEDGAKQPITSESTRHPSRIAAEKSVAKIAGALVCPGCEYSTMTPVQVSNARTELAEAEMARLRAYRELSTELGNMTLDEQAGIQHLQERPQLPPQA